MLGDIPGTRVQTHGDGHHGAVEAAQPVTPDLRGLLGYRRSHVRPGLRFTAQRPEPLHLEPASPQFVLDEVRKVRPLVAAEGNTQMESVARASVYLDFRYPL